MAHDDDTATAEPQQPCVQPDACADDVADQPCAAQELLAEHVPLALIVDLVTPAVSSEEILQAEGLPDEPWWEPEAEPTGGADGTEPTRGDERSTGGDEQPTGL